MTYDLSDRTALVTGGTRGIGKAISKSFLNAGANVIITGKTKNPKDFDCEGSEVSYENVDFTDIQAATDFAKRISQKKIDILVNNAGINKISPLADIEYVDLSNILKVNLIAPILICQALMPKMAESGYGRVVNIGSIFGRVSKEFRTSYSASKFGLEGITRSIALEYANKNVLINCISPGFIDTELTRQMLTTEQLQSLTEEVPLKRLGTPDEIASIVQFLASDKNSYCTGETIIADGGFTCV